MTPQILHRFFDEWIIEPVWETIKNRVLDYFICWCFTTHPALRTIYFIQEWYNLFSNSDVYVRHFNSYLVLNISWYQNTEPLCPPKIFFSLGRYSPHVRESRIPEYGKILFMESGTLGCGIWNLTNDWNPESKFYWQIQESSFLNPESRIQDRPGFSYVGRRYHQINFVAFPCTSDFFNSTSDALHNLNWLLHLCWSEPERKL